jgi:hypothetical protein
MEIIEARKIGGRIALKTLTISLLVADCINLFLQTQGDFANGILFFIADHFSIGFILLLAVLYGSAYLFGRRAGKAILINNKSYLITGILYAFITIAIYLAIFAIGTFIPLIVSGKSSWTPVVLEYHVTWLKIVDVIILIVWLLAAVQIKRKTTTPTNKQSYGI